MTWADLIAAIVKSGIDMDRTPTIRIADNQSVLLAEFQRSGSAPLGRLVPAAPLYTQADLDAAREEAYEQGVSDAKAGIECLEPAGAEGGGR